MKQCSINIPLSELYNIISSKILRNEQLSEIAL